jgi:hypothetical protein
MRLNLFARRVDILRQAGHLEHRFFVPRRGDNVGVRLLLDAFDGGALRADHETDDAVRHAHLNGGLARRVGHQLTEGQRGVDVVLARGADLGEVLGGGEDLALGEPDVLLAAGYDEDRFLAPYRGLDVGVRLGAQGLDLASCRKKGFILSNSYVTSGIKNK